MTKEEANRRVAELSDLTHKMFIDYFDNLKALKANEEYQKASDELDELLDYRKDMWPDDHDERNWGLVNDERDFRHGEIGLVFYVSHSEVGLRFIDGVEHYYHSMGLKPIKSSPEIRALWGEIPLSQYFKKRKEAKND